MKNLYTSLLYICLILIIGIATEGLIYLFLTNKSFNNTVTLATTVKPETFTELYFTNHESLPTDVTPGKIYPFSFTIHNEEEKTETYPYEVYLDIGNENLPIDSGVITLNTNEEKTITEEFSIDSTIKRSQVTVNLTNKRQKIAFWIEGGKK